VLNQLNLVVRDMDATVAFYKRLGLPIKVSPGAQHASATLPNGLLVEFDTVAFVPQWDTGWRGSTGGSTVLGFSVPSREAVDSLYSELTSSGYAATLDYGRTAFGDKLVRSLTASDVDSFLGLMAGVSPSTQAKHLRVLSSCLKAAVKRGYAARNPIDSLGAAERPSATRKESAYFLDAELPKLFSKVREWDRPLFRAALTTGMRQGELLALRWGDVNLTEPTIRVRRIYAPGIGETNPKSRAGVRDVDIHNGAVDVFEVMLKELGSPPPDDALVFPGPNGHRHGSSITRNLYGAMLRAGVPREGPTGEKRTFHSFRHSYAKVAIESGTLLTWLQRQLGHSSLNVTADTYGHFESAARKVESAKMEDAFSV